MGPGHDRITATDARDPSATTERRPRQGTAEGGHLASREEGSPPPETHPRGTSISDAQTSELGADKPLSLSPPRLWYSGFGRLRPWRSQSLGVSKRGCCLISDSALDSLEHMNPKSGEREPGVASGPRAPGTPAPGWAWLQDRPGHPRPPTPQDPGDRGPTTGPQQPEWGSGRTSPLRPQPRPQSAVPPRTPPCPEQVGTCSYFPWAHRLFELTFTSSQRPGQALSDSVA